MGKNLTNIMPKSCNSNLLFPYVNKNKPNVNVAYIKENIILIKPSDQKNSADILEEINDIILNGQCHNIILDLTDLSFLKSITVGVLASTYHFVEFITGTIYLVVQDRQAKSSIEKLNLSNTIIIYNDRKLCFDDIV